MTYLSKTSLVGTSVVLLAASTSVWGQDTVSVSSLSGLQTAINNAPASGRTITLAPGVYRENRPIRIQGKKNLTVQGATSDASDTVIKGPGINNAGLYINIRVNNADHLTIKNLTLRDCARPDNNTGLLSNRMGDRRDMIPRVRVDRSLANRSAVRVLAERDGSFSAARRYPSLERINIWRADNRLALEGRSTIGPPRRYRITNDLILRRNIRLLVFRRAIASSAT